MSLSQMILILDSKGDKSPYIEGIISNDSSINLVIVDNVQESSEVIEKHEPDLVLIHDNFDEDIVEICSSIRSKTGFYRPVIMVLSGTENVEKKIQILKSGADDYQNISIDKKELSLRIFAHLRRHIEELTDPVTKLPGLSLSYRILKRNITTKARKHYALMYLDIDNLEPYKEIYGHIASEKLLQTFIAIVKTSLNEEDFLGRIGHDAFVILTTPEKAEKIAVFLSYSFDMVSQKFYNGEDIDRGYLILDGDEKIGRRIPFVSVSIGIVSSLYKSFNSIEDLMNTAISVHRLAKSKTGSSWISDRPKITGSETTIDKKRKILIVENDASLLYLLTTTLEMQGYSVEAVNSFEHTPEMVEKTEPDIVVFDTKIDNEKNELDMCRNIKETYPNIKVIVSTVDCSKEKILDTGVDLYIPKPYELIVLFNWINRFLSY